MAALKSMHLTTSRDILKQEVCDANRKLARSGLVKLTWGNVSGLDHSSGLIVIKPSGVPYEDMDVEHMVTVDLSGQVVEGRSQPSVDTETHLVLYRRFPGLGAVVHMHSVHATCFSQARMSIPCLGTTHADHFCGPIPVTRDLTPSEMENYEESTGEVIAELFDDVSPFAIPAALIGGHAPFIWGRSVADAMDNAVALEAIAELAMKTLQLQPNAKLLPESIRDFHFYRKHGPNARYGVRGSQKHQFQHKK